MILTNTYQANVYAFERLGYSRRQAETLIAIGILVAKKLAMITSLKRGNMRWLLLRSDRTEPIWLMEANIGRLFAEYSAVSGFSCFAFTNDLKTRSRLSCIRNAAQTFWTVSYFGVVETKAKYIASLCFLYFTRWKDLKWWDKVARSSQKVASYPQVFAVGVNCVAPDLVEKAIKTIRQVTTKKIIVYPNLDRSMIQQLRPGKNQITPYLLPS